MAVLPGRSEPLLLTRLEHNEDKFIERCDDDTDGVIINHRFDTGSRLGMKRTAIENRIPFLIDLETWRLPFLSGPEDDSFGSDAETLLASSVPLPVSPSDLDGHEALEKLVRAAVRAQTGALYTFAPYFQVNSLTDPWLDVNLRAIRELRRLASRQPLATWVYVSFEAMAEGLVPYLAERYRSVLPPGSTVVLTVSDIRAGEKTPVEIATYLEAIASFRAKGIHVVADRASEISVAAVAAGAGGCLLGNRIYRTAPASPIWTYDFNPAIKLRFFDGERVRKVDRKKAKERGRRGKLACRYAPAECDAINAGKKRNVEVRLHASHEMRDVLRRAERLGAGGLQDLWADAPLKQLREFSQALALAAARSQEA